MITRFLAGLGAASIALILPAVASAQDVPSYAMPAAADAPSYAQPAVPSYATQDQQIHGRVVGFDGGYNLQVRDDSGYLDNVQLHQGTVINPTGITLASGMIVSINGYNQGSFFAANEIDTPYQLYGAVPYYAGHPWYYYGPSISLGFFFGNAGWWHGSYARPYAVERGVRVVNRYPEAYRGGTWNGRNYVAPQSRGGYVPQRSGYSPQSRGNYAASRGATYSQGYRGNASYQRSAPARGSESHANHGDHGH